jgi:hypothetical protein
MSVYDLNNAFYLQHDIDDILNRIDSIYDIEFFIDKTIFKSKIVVDKTNFWFSDVTQQKFNDSIPIVKSLTKDMYAILETYYKSKNGKFDNTDKQDLESKYLRLKELRLLNNKFKHYNDQGAEISLTSIVLMEQNCHVIDIYCNFKYKDNFEGFLFSNLIEVFLKILEDNMIIKITKK